MWQDIITFILSFIDLSKRLLPKPRYDKGRIKRDRDIADAIKRRDGRKVAGEFKKRKRYKNYQK